MLKIWFSIFCIFCITSASDVKNDLYELTILHFNDFHARFEQTSTSGTKCNDEEGTTCIGGFPRLYTKINEMKAMKPNSILLDAGDSFQGTLWYNILRWNVTQHFMNLLPIDAHTLGNHELDHGIEGCVPYLEHLKSPVVVSNIDDSNEPTIQGLYEKSVVIEKGGQKIGIIGAIISTAHELAQTEGLIFLDEVAAVKAEADRLAATGVNKIIVLSHSGINTDRIIARDGGDNIDVIVGGHSHTLLYTGTPSNGDRPVDVYPVVVEQASGNKVLIVQASAHTRYLGHLDVFFDAQGRVVRWAGNPIFLENSIVQDEFILNEMQPFKELVDIEGKRVIGESRVLLARNPCGSTECNLGNFVTDGFVDSFIQSKEDSWTYAAICMTNQGGIRTDIRPGVVTYEELILAQPFGNSLHTFDIEGKYILQAMEFAVNRTDVGPFFSNIMLQMSGIRVVYNITNPVGERVVQALVRCQKCQIPSYSPLDPEAVYKVIAPSFLSEGGDGFVVLSENKKNTELWGIDADILEKYFYKEKLITHGEDRRIVVVT